MDVYDILEAVEHNPLAHVLATVIHVEGHAYRKQGAIMVLMADGRTIGSISPGCLEADLAAYVPSVWDSQKPQMVEYDMRPADDFGWGETIGCGGLIRILLEPIAGELLVHLLIAKASLDRGDAVELIREYGEGYSDVRYALSMVREAPGVLRACEDRGAFEAQAISGERFLVKGHEFTNKRALSAFGTVTRLEPKPRLIIFGANPDAAPLVQMAANSGFRVVVADWRDALCTMERFPGASEAVVAFPEALAARLALTPGDYVIIMSHQFEKDEAFVRQIAPFPLRYLGIMGSRERTERLMAGLRQPKWLHYPVGLPIGSEGAYENAISMTAELIAVKRGVRGSETESPRDDQGDVTERSVCDDRGSGKGSSVRDDQGDVTERSVRDHRGGKGSSAKDDQGDVTERSTHDHRGSGGYAQGAWVSTGRASTTSRTQGGGAS
ncbi:XdhC family protein [Paenibacillus whitsoniae]|uniref:XdhC/CoxI family protein n=1 Tax=Paenibacillus whitsoniae TaxID=2496558 RepID=A0A430JHQ8_9BACL|nr:XdhC/CoxI family protein [Paenibacillus whitsoniae]RTE10581.1 XdhC/CoxI family protein [Paenibacillus whitsoniae]